jgi:hypothetical protein
VRIKKPAQQLSAGTDFNERDARQKPRKPVGFAGDSPDLRRPRLRSYAGQAHWRDLNAGRRGDNPAFVNAANAIPFRHADRHRPAAARYPTERFATLHRHYCAGLASMIAGCERYFGGFFTSLSISRHVSNST